jgi:hypothetical protein
MAAKKTPVMVDNNAASSSTAEAEDEVQPTAKSAEDRKAASALAKLDGAGEEVGPAKEVDQEAVSKAMKSLGDAGAKAVKKEVKNVKVDQADVALLVCIQSSSS